MTPSFGAALSNGRNAAAVASMFAARAVPHFGPTVARTCCTSIGSRETCACAEAASIGASSAAIQAQRTGGIGLSDGFAFGSPHYAGAYMQHQVLRHPRLVVLTSLAATVEKIDERGLANQLNPLADRHGGAR